MFWSLDGQDWQVTGFLGEDWRLRGAEREGYAQPCFPARVPGSVLSDMVRAGEVADPRFGRNSLHAEWVPERTWVYRKRFALPDTLRGQRAELVFQGVDFQCEFYLNDEWLGEHASQCVPARFDVTERLRFDAPNFLAVVLQKAPENESQIGRTDAVRLHRSRMDYGWDFCPRSVHQGIWQSVGIECTGGVQIRELCVRPELDERCAQAVVRVQARLEAQIEGEYDAECVLISPDGEAQRLSMPRALSPGQSDVDFSFTLAAPRLWWTNGLGEQALYTLEVRVLDGERCLCQRSERTGIRRLRFVPNEGAEADALPYVLEVNGVRTYINGWNWVPIAAQYGEATLEQYRHLLTLCRNAHGNLLRVWGGGLIEREEFYSLCDELGILVWQEFQLSSSGVNNEPSDDPEYIALLRREAEAIVPLRRNHASLAIWCGGNELAREDVPLTDEAPALQALREVVRRLDPGRQWLPTSPSGRAFNNTWEAIQSDPGGMHDVHGPWEHQGLQRQYALYNAGASLLSSEFGTEGMTNRNTLRYGNPPEALWPPDRSNALYLHRGAWWIHYDSLQRCFGNAIRTIDQAVSASQFLQAEGLRYAVEANRRRQFHCAGTLPWQFNEPFPNNYCTSAVDAYGQPKAAYYAVGRAYRPCLLSARFDAQALQCRPEFECAVYLSTTAQSDLSGSCTVRLLDMQGTVRAENTRAVQAAANGTTWLFDWSVSVEGLALFLLEVCGSFGEYACCARYVFTAGEDFASLLTQPGAVLRAESANGALRVENRGKDIAIGVMVEESDAVPGYATYIQPIDSGYATLLPGEAFQLPDWGKRPARVTALNMAQAIEIREIR